MIETLARWWAVDDSHHLPKEVDLIALVAHGANQNGLALGSLAVCLKAQKLSEDYPKAMITFGSFSGGNEKKEKEIKASFFPKGLYIGGVLTTIAEAAANSQVVGIKPRSIIVVTDEAHSRRCRIVWKVFFPESNIFIVPVKIADTLDPKSPMSTYHNMLKILALQAGPTPIFWWWARKGPEYLLGKAKKYHQPIAH